MQSQNSFLSQEVYPLRDQLQGFSFEQEVKRQDSLTEEKMSWNYLIDKDYLNFSQMEMMKKTNNSSESLFLQKIDKKTTFFDHVVCIEGNPCFEICCYQNCNKSAIICNKRECACRIEHQKQFPDPNEMCIKIDPKFLLEKIQTSCNREEYIQREFSKMRHIVSKNFLEFVLAVKKIEDKALKSLNALEEKVRRQKDGQYFSEPQPTAEEKWFLGIAQNTRERQEELYFENLQEVTGKKISEVKASIVRKKQQSGNLLSAICDKLSDKLNQKLPALHEKLKQMGENIEEIGKTKSFETEALHSLENEHSQPFVNEPSHYERNIGSNRRRSHKSRYDIYHSKPRRVSKYSCKKRPRSNTKNISGFVDKLFHVNPFSQIANKISFANKNYSKIIKTNNEAQTLFEFFEDVNIDFERNGFKKCKKTKDYEEQPMLQLLYRASERNFSMHLFHRLCENKPNTIIFIKTKGGQKIGGFTPCLWNIADKDKKKGKSKKCDPSGQTFIFSVTTQSKFKMTDDSEAIDSRSNGFGFRGKPDSKAFDLYIYNGHGRQLKGYALYANNFQHKSYKKFDPQSYQRFHGEKEHKFLIEECEVYQIKAPVQK